MVANKNNIKQPEPQRFRKQSTATTGESKSRTSSNGMFSCVDVVVVVRFFPFLVHYARLILNNNRTKFNKTPQQQSLTS